MRKRSTHEILRLTNEAFRQARKIDVVVVLDNVRSQHNIGSVFRTADAFRVHSVHLCGITATPPNREIHKTALGATDTVQWMYFEKTADSLQTLRNNGFVLVSVEQTTESILVGEFKPDPAVKYALIFGNEVHGIEDDVINSSDFCLEIPQEGTKHSLNVSVSAGIVLWEFFRQLSINLRPVQ